MLWIVAAWRRAFAAAARLDSWLRAHAPAAAAAFTAAALAWIFWGFQQGYDSNDDVGMMLIASGFRGGAPSEYLVFTNPLIGLALRVLYATWPKWPWYAVYLHAGYALATYAITYLLVRHAGLAGLVLRLVMFCLVGFGHILSLQFTTVAALAAMAGGALLTEMAGAAGASLAAAPARRPALTAQHLHQLLGSSLLVVAGMVRFHGALFGLVLVAPWIALRCWELRRTRNVLLAFAIVASLLGATRAFHLHYYNGDARTEDVLAFNRARSIIHDRGVVQATEDEAPFYAHAEWSTNDIAALRKSWFFADRQVYSLPRVRSVAEAYLARAVSAEQMRETLSKAWEETETRPFAAFIAVVLVLATHRWRALVLYVALFAVTSGLAVAFASLGRLPDRIWEPLFRAHVLVGGLYLATHFRARVWVAPGGASAGPLRWTAWLRLPAALAALGILGWAAHVQLEVEKAQSRERRTDNARLVRALRELSAAGAETGTRPVYVLFGPSLELQHLDPWRDTADLKGMELVTGGWSTFTPSHDAQLARLGITDVYTDLAKRHDMFLVAKAKHARHYLTFVAERRGRRYGLLPMPGFRALARAARARVYRVQDLGPAAQVGSAPPR